MCVILVSVAYGGNVVFHYLHLWIVFIYSHKHAVGDKFHYFFGCEWSVFEDYVCEEPELICCDKNHKGYMFS